MAANSAANTKVVAPPNGGGGRGKGKKGSSNPKKNPKPRKQPPAGQHPTPTPQAATDPPLECSRDAFRALLGDAAGLADAAEASAELLDCARHGEVDACRALLDVWSRENEGHADRRTGDPEEDGPPPPPPLVDAHDAARATPLHKACANGRTATARLLLSRGARHAPNDSGNTPLHWAAGGGHAACVHLLLDHYDVLSSKDAREEKGGGGVGRGSVRPVDVLRKNDFGRSALTEGFAKGDAATVNYLLNHDSAEEEKLIGGLDKEDVEDAGEAHAVAAGAGGARADDKKRTGKEGIVHEFDFLRGKGDVESSEDEGRPSVLIRELPIAHADDPFGQAPIEDTTGLGIWCAALVMARWLASPSMVQRLKNKTVLELGAGCGIPALTAAIYGQPKSVTITDLNPDTVDNARHNIALNRCAATTASSIDWGDAATYPADDLDYVICSDCIYQKDIVPLLRKVVAGLLRPRNGSFLYVAPEGGRDGLPEFIAAMKGEGFACVREEAAPERYRENPLKNGDEEDCFLHFHELARTAYVLYEFRRC